jgi:hypothetical protein
MFSDTLTIIKDEDCWQVVDDRCGNSGVRKFQCLSCPYQTKNVGHMKQHYNDKHSPNPITFTCPYCTYSPKQAIHLERHISKVHRDIWKP